MLGWYRSHRRRCYELRGGEGRAQSDEGSRVTGEGRQWTRLLEALEGLCNRGLSEGVCIQRKWCCMLHAEKSYLAGQKAAIYRGNPGPRTEEADGGGRRPGMVQNERGI